MSEIEKITYEEAHENGFLERLLMDRRLTLTNTVYFACAVIAIGLAVFQLYVAAFGTPEGRSFRTIHLSTMLVLAICMFPLFRRSTWEPVSQGNPGDTIRWLGLPTARRVTSRISRMNKPPTIRSGSSFSPKRIWNAVMS